MIGSKANAKQLCCMRAMPSTAPPGKVYPDIVGNRARFTRLLRENHAVLGPLGMPGIDLDETRFPVSIKKSTAPGGKPDLADVIYSVHRCSHAHGDELPDGFDLIKDAAGTARLTCLIVEKGKLRLSDRIICGLLVVAILSPVNRDQVVPDGYFLTFGDTRLATNDWRGRGADFLALAAAETLPSVKLDFGDWMG